ncbi:hypothetical protein JQ617_29205 [Bradyrhizobium sp. KB893862 SZCCT0404]|uniref:hypothetical protein n=1 Tax=Bradyrhizobium sp. KB893862 SZCCT0404 TaxID=2807672 RepID=UPI001BA6F179|nr:hypothetical protein [Bradyrhizobium sp. KB893862 SZCCT0404]MBR1178070.1 hypothetical protein [Bradyrhizobium sp. KB893862 SZCCT0404]
MLVVTIELWPGGLGALRRPIGTLHIGNDSNLADVSDYRVIAMELANPLIGTPAGVARFRVLDHDRRQRVWALLQRASEEAMKADWVSKASE